ncbi:MAG: hypothetical protein M3Y54_22280 [Bacteroidota bacterium]|nr:hypothetical protein [Bacteroidota bacterium]
MNAPAAPVVEHHPLHHRRHAIRQRAKAFSHLFPALVLVQGAVEALSTGELEWVRGLELAVGLAYVGLLIRELRHLRRHPTGAAHHGPEWLELAAAGILALEGYHIWHRHHEAELASGIHRTHYLPWIYGGLTLVYVGLAFGAGRLAARQGLHFTQEGFWMRLLPISRVRRVRWSDLQAVTVAPNATDLLLHPRAGGPPQLLKLSAYHNGEVLRERILAHYQSAISSEQ